MASDDTPVVAVLGTGIMGAAMARRWAEHGFPVTVWNRDRSKAEALTDSGAAVADTPADAVSGADVVVTMLAGLAEAIALAERIGVDPAQFLAAIDGGPLGSGYASVKGPMMIDRTYPTAFPLHLLTKDVELVADAAAAAGVALRLPVAIRSLLADAETGYSDDDMAAIIEALRR